MMRCPECLAPNAYVLDSRTTGGGEEVRRRRICNACQHRWTTYEISEEVHTRMRELWRARKIAHRALVGALEALQEEQP